MDDNINLKKPITYEEQVNKLREHNLEINDSKKVISFLESVNYYRFTGYLVQFRETKGEGKLDPSLHVQFDKARSIYEFDRELRNFLLRYLEIVEVYCRSLIAYEFSRAVCVTEPFNQHYLFQRYSKPDKAEELFHKIEENIDRFKDSLIIKHHKAQYGGKYPVWVIVEMLSFSELSKLYSCLPEDVKVIIARRMQTSADTMENYMHCLSVLRNKCAHAGRLYNSNMTNPTPRFSKRLLKARPDFKKDSLFAFVVTVSKCLPIDEQKSAFITEFSALMDKYHNAIDLKTIGVVEDYAVFLSNHTKGSNQLLVENFALTEDLNTLKEKNEKRTAFWKLRKKKIANVIHWILQLAIITIPAIVFTALSDYVKAKLAMGTESVFFLSLVFFALAYYIITYVCKWLKQKVQEAADNLAERIIKQLAPQQDLEEDFDE